MPKYDDYSIDTSQLRLVCIDLSKLCNLQWGKSFSNFCIQEFELYNQYCHTQRDTSESLPEDHSTTATAIEVVTSSMQPQNHDLKIRYALSLKMGVASEKSARIKSLQVYSYQDKGGFHLVDKIIR